MHNYTMTFKYDGDLDLPDDQIRLEREVPKTALEKLQSHDFELIDFNLTQNYDSSNAGRYIGNPAVNRSVMEIRLDLTRENLKSREAIYARCLGAMERGELRLAFACENEDKSLRQWQSIIIFDMPERMEDGAKKAKNCEESQLEKR
jgi:hypothetical protein